MSTRTPLVKIPGVFVGTPGTKGQAMMTHTHLRFERNVLLLNHRDVMHWCVEIRIQIGVRSC